MNAIEPKTQYRRKYPRRNFKGAVGVLSQGHYSIHETGEVGEGGISVLASQALPESSEVCVSFQIPGGGDFISLRAQIRWCREVNGQFLHGLAFEDVAFFHKRQIRTYVSARHESEVTPE